MVPVASKQRVGQQKSKFKNDDAPLILVLFFLRVQVVAWWVEVWWWAVVEWCSNPCTEEVHKCNKRQHQWCSNSHKQVSGCRNRLLVQCKDLTHTHWFHLFFCTCTEQYQQRRSPMPHRCNNKVPRLKLSKMGQPPRRRRRRRRNKRTAVTWLKREQWQEKWFGCCRRIPNFKTRNF